MLSPNMGNVNMVPIHRKSKKQLGKNYRPVFLLIISGKIFQKILFNSLLNYLDDNNLLNNNQSGFRSGDSCARQLLAITNDIVNAFYKNQSLEVRGVFLNLSKAFDKVWHERLMYELKRLGICGKYPGLIISFLSNQCQRVVFSGHPSCWS